MHRARLRPGHRPAASRPAVTLSEHEYQAHAIPELNALLYALDAAELDGCDAELESDILTLEFADGTRYVVNSHRAARQIWMAADSSAWHFDYDTDSGKWIAHKSGDELWSTLERTVSARLGKPVTLRRSA
jgi:CyaY protein